MIIHADHGALGSGFVGELYERFPDFGFFEDEDLDNFPILAKQLIEVVMGDHIAVFVIDADEEHRPVHFCIHFGL